MNSFTAENTVGEIASGDHRSVRVFEQLGIDFCCGGRVALRHACLVKGLDPGDVLDQIRRAAPPAAPEVDWQAAPLSALIVHILSTHHAYMKAQLPRLDGMLQKILSKHGDRHGNVLRPMGEIFQAMREELENHLMKEELILFPLIQRLEGSGGPEVEFHCGSLRNPIRVMVAEHDSAGEGLARLRELSSGYQAPTDACTTFRACYAELAEMESDLHRHIHLENNILFPRAVALEDAVSR